MELFLLALRTSCTFTSSQNWVIRTNQLAISLCPRIWQYHCPLVLSHIDIHCMSQVSAHTTVASAQNMILYEMRYDCMRNEVSWWWCEHSSCGCIEKDSAHVDSESLAWPLIDTIAVVVELSERGTEVIRIVAEGVRGQVSKDITMASRKLIGPWQVWVLFPATGRGWWIGQPSWCGWQSAVICGPAAKQMRQKGLGSVCMTQLEELCES